MAKFRFWRNLLSIVLLFNFCGFELVAQGEKSRSAEYYFRVGELQLEKHDWTGALASFDDCLRQDPRYADAYYSRAIVHEHFDSLNRALTDYNIYLELRPQHHEALFGRAQIRQQLGQYALAKSDFISLLSLPPGETTTVFFRQEVYTGAVDQVFTSRGADKAYIFNAIGLTDMKLGDYAEAIQFFDSALVITPNDPDLFVNRGTAHEKLADTTAAMSDYRRALIYNSTHAIAKHNLSAISKGRNLPSSDLTLLNEAIEDNPSLPYTYAERGYIHFQKGNYAAAMIDYNKAIQIDPRQPEYFLNRGLIKEKMKDLDGAYIDYTTAIKLQNSFDKAWLNRGNLLARLGKLHEAVDDYTIAILHSPDYASAFYNRAMAKNRLQQKTSACEDLTTAEQLGATVDSKAKKSICGN